MSYREYTTPNGKTYARHNNGHYFTGPACVLPMPDDSKMWESAANSRLRDLAEMLGQTDYRAWWARTFEKGGHDADAYTWRQIATAALIEIEHPTECTCDPLRVCELCASIAHEVAESEALPY